MYVLHGSAFSSRNKRTSRGFTVTELLVVVGLISVLISLLFPVAAKVRFAANSARCSSNLRQMGMAWTMYVAENHGQVLDYIWHNPASPQLAYAAYWPGALELEGVKGDALLCPAATEPTGVATGRGYG